MAHYCNTCEFTAEMDISQLSACDCNTEVAPTAITKEWSYV